MVCVGVPFEGVRDPRQKERQKSRFSEPRGGGVGSPQTAEKTGFSEDQNRCAGQVAAFQTMGKTSGASLRSGMEREKLAQAARRQRKKWGEKAALRRSVRKNRAKTSSCVGKTAQVRSDAKKKDKPPKDAEKRAANGMALKAAMGWAYPASLRERSFLFQPAKGPQTKAVLSSVWARAQSLHKAKRWGVRAKVR